MCKEPIPAPKVIVPKQLIEDIENKLKELDVVHGTLLEMQNFERRLQRLLGYPYGIPRLKRVAPSLEALSNLVLTLHDSRDCLLRLSEGKEEVEIEIEIVDKIEEE